MPPLPSHDAFIRASLVSEREHHIKMRRPALQRCSGCGELTNHTFSSPATDPERWCDTCWLRKIDAIL